MEEKFTLCVTTEILAEYEEIIARESNPEMASLALQLIENAVNTKLITRYYKWNLIQNDPDDNKFVDCAIASNARFIVTEDKHFNILENVRFPKVHILDVQGFKDKISNI